MINAPARDTAARASDWVAVHVFYHDDLDQVVVHAVRPLVAELGSRGLATEYFFLRYWNGGPHVRLRVLPCRAVDREAVVGVISDSLTRFLARHPATTMMSPEEYDGYARTLGEWEAERDVARLRSNNSFAFLDYRRESGRYGVGPGMQAVERHFCDASRIALCALVRGADRSRLTNAALAILFLTWFTYDDDRRLVAQALRETGQAIVAPSAYGGGVPADGPLPREVLRLADQMSQLARLDAASRPATGTLAEWLGTILRLSATLDGPRNRTLRVVDTCAHLMLNRLGVALGTETGLRAVASRAVDELDRSVG